MYENLTDEQLMHLLHDDDRKAFDEIYSRYWEQMSLYVLKVIRSQEDASDIVQDVFVSIWKRRSDLLIGNLKAYLFRSVRNLSIRYIEKNIRKQDFLRSLAFYFQELDVSAMNALELQELNDRLSGVVSKLPVKMQKVFVLSRQEELSHKEIAQRLGIAETTVKKQVSNALKLIRSEVSSAGIISLFCLLFL